jgi:hypothetical protein
LFLPSLSINVSAAIEVMTNLKLWTKFEDNKTLSLASIVEESKADETMISAFPSPSSKA